MSIEIRGVNFINKGAELMLHAVVQQAQQWTPRQRLVLGFGQGHLAGAGTLGLARLALIRKKWIDFRLPKVLVPSFIEDRLGLVAEQSITTVLDASGFNYGDQWGDKPLLSLARFLRRWHRPGRHYIMLPQALGPFTSAAMRQAMSQVAARADLIFARDPTSLEHVTRVVGKQPQIRLAPDFTNLVKGYAPAAYQHLREHFALVPNNKMIEHATGDGAEAYLELFLALIKELQQNRVGCFLLVHDRAKDQRLAEKINQLLQQRLRLPQLEIVCATDPLAIKGILGRCSGVFSSRFHGLVSALSQGVPVLATGWSHKYEQLLNDYRCPEQFIANPADTDHARYTLQRMLNHRSREQMLSTIASSAVEQKRQAQEMWDTVRDRVCTPL